MNILIIKIGAIGDVVMASPLIPAIRKKHPGAHITWLCGKTVAPILQAMEGIDESLVVDETRLLSGSFFQRFAEILKIWKTLFLRRFDLCLYFYYSELYKILVVPARFNRVLRFNKNPKNRINPLPGQHHTHAYLATFLEPEGAFELEIFYPKLNLGGQDGNTNGDHSTKKVALSCGGALNFLRSDDVRRWPIEFYVQLAEKLLKAGYQVILTGAPGDAWVSDHFGHLPVENKIGKLNLLQFISFLKGCHVLVTHDSGPLHLADLADCPVVGIFGPTQPANFKSLQSKSIHLWGGENLHCRPCYDGRAYARCHNNLCMQATSVPQVFEAAMAILEPSGFQGQAD